MQKKKECIESKCHRLIVAGIDFGTTFSGFAFSQKSDWKKVAVELNFGFNYESSKCPTVLLLNPDKSFLAFGSEALNIYVNLMEDSTSDSDSSDSDLQEETGCIAIDYYYFCDFKKLLLNKNVSFLMFYNLKCICMMHEKLCPFMVLVLCWTVYLYSLQNLFF